MKKLFGQILEIYLLKQSRDYNFFLKVWMGILHLPKRAVKVNWPFYSGGTPISFMLKYTIIYANFNVTSIKTPFFEIYTRGITLKSISVVSLMSFTLMKANVKFNKNFMAVCLKGLNMDDFRKGQHSFVLLGPEMDQFV